MAIGNAGPSAKRTKPWDGTPVPITFLGGIFRSPEELKHKLVQFKERSDHNGDSKGGWITRQEIDEYIMQTPLHAKTAYKKLVEAATSTGKEVDPARTW